MSRDQKSIQFILDVAALAAEFDASSKIDRAAASELLAVARTAIASPQESLPINHYLCDVRNALYTAFGVVDFTRLSGHQKSRAVWCWDWFARTFGELPDDWDLAGAIDAIRR